MSAAVLALTLACALCNGASLEIVPADLRLPDQDLVYWPLGKEASQGFLYRHYSKATKDATSDPFWYPARYRVYFVGDIPPDYRAGKMLSLGSPVASNAEHHAPSDPVLELLNQRVQTSPPPDKFMVSGVILLIVVGAVERGEVAALFIMGEELYCAGPRSRGHRGWITGLRGAEALKPFDDANVRRLLFTLPPAASFAIGRRGIAVAEETGNTVRLQVQPAGAWAVILPESKREQTFAKDEFNDLFSGVEQGLRRLADLPEETEERQVDPILLLATR